MITRRAAHDCGKADFGWLQARYTFSFGHYFDPKLLGYASLRVLNQEVLAPGASFQPRTYPNVDVLNIILQGEAEYRDSEGNHTVGRAGEALLLATRPGIIYSEHNLSKTLSLNRMQLWVDARPLRKNSPVQHINKLQTPYSLLASPTGEKGSLQLRQQMWLHHLKLDKGERFSIPLQGRRGYLQTVHGLLQVQAATSAPQRLTSGDGAFIVKENQLKLFAQALTQVLVIDLPL